MTLKLFQSNSSTQKFVPLSTDPAANSNDVLSSLPSAPSSSSISSGIIPGSNWFQKIFHQKNGYKKISLPANNNDNKDNSNTDLDLNPVRPSNQPGQRSLHHYPQFILASVAPLPSSTSTSINRNQSYKPLEEELTQFDQEPWWWSWWWPTSSSVSSSTDQMDQVDQPNRKIQITHSRTIPNIATTAGSGGSTSKHASQSCESLSISPNSATYRHHSHLSFGQSSLSAMSLYTTSTATRGRYSSHNHYLFVLSIVLLTLLNPTAIFDLSLFSLTPTTTSTTISTSVSALAIDLAPPPPPPPPTPTTATPTSTLNTPTFHLRHKFSSPLLLLLSSSTGNTNRKPASPSITTSTTVTSINPMETWGPVPLTHHAHSHSHHHHQSRPGTTTATYRCNMTAYPQNVGCNPEESICDLQSGNCLCLTTVTGSDLHRRTGGRRSRHIGTTTSLQTCLTPVTALGQPCQSSAQCWTSVANSACFAADFVRLQDWRCACSLGFIEKDGKCVASSSDSTTYNADDDANNNPNGNLRNYLVAPPDDSTDNCGQSSSSANLESWQSESDFRKPQLLWIPMLGRCIESDIWYAFRVGRAGGGRSGGGQGGVGGRSAGSRSWFNSPTKKNGGATLFRWTNFLSASSILFAMSLMLIVL